MEVEKDPKDPSVTSAAYDAMCPIWSMLTCLMGGTLAMRAAGESFLPKHPKETQERYDERLKVSVLVNKLNLTLNSLAGKPFSEPVMVGDNVPERIKSEILEDVDLQGNCLDVFAKRWFEQGLLKAFCHVLIEFPRPSPRADGRPRTVEDDRKDNLRPYWVLVEPESVIFARSESINGREVLTHVRIMESVVEPNGFSETVLPQIRVLEPGSVSLYRIRESNKTKQEWVLHDEWKTALGYIPFVTFYANRTGLMMGKPPLEDLAHLNVTHWQSNSDQRSILTVSRFPMLARSGVSAGDAEQTKVGPFQTLSTDDPAGKFYYVEPQGTAIAAGATDLENLERQMSEYGAEFLRKKPGQQTATARALDSAEATSDLSSMAVEFEDAVAQALDITAEWMKLGVPGGTIQVVTEYDIEEQDGTAVTAAKDARASRDISRKAYLAVLKAHDVLPEDFDEDEDLQELLEETTTLLGQATEDLDPGAPTPPEEKKKKPEQ